MTTEMVPPIDPRAYIDDSVVLGKGTVVRQFASISRGTIMGERCSVSPFAMLDGSVYGDGVIVSGGVMAGAGFYVGDGVFLGPNVVLCNDCWPFASKGGYDDARLRANEEFAVVIEAGAAIGAGAIIMPGVRIGAGAVVAAGAVVDRDVEPGMVYGKGGMRPVPDWWARKRHRWISP